MATVLGDGKIGLDGRTPSQSWKVFSPAQRQQMLRDDVEAGMTVALILTGVVFAGLVLVLIGVTLSL
jgi:hypothetical protein